MRQKIKLDASTFDSSLDPKVFAIGRKKWNSFSIGMTCLMNIEYIVL